MDFLISSLPIIPLILILVVCFCALLLVPRTFSDPKEHYLASVKERDILSGNISSAFSVMNLGVLYLWSFSNWGTPSCLTVIVAVACAHLAYILLVVFKVDHFSVLSWVGKNVARKNYLRWLVGLSVCMITVEFAFLRHFLSELFELYGYTEVHAALVVFAVAVFCVFYVFWGGIRAALYTDMGLIIVSAIILVGWLFTRDVSLPYSVSDFLPSELEKYDASEWWSFMNYASASACVFSLYFMVPDYWHRNVNIKPTSRKARCRTLFLSMVVHILLIYMVYIFAAKLRPSFGVEHLYENIPKDAFSISAIIEFIQSNMLLDDIYIFIILAFALIAFTLTTVDSIIISIVSISFEEQLAVNTKKERTFEDYLWFLYQMVFLGVLVSCLSNFSFSSVLGMVVTACLLVLLLAMWAKEQFASRSLPFSDGAFLFFIFLGMAIFWHINDPFFDGKVYYALSGAITAILSCWLQWGYLKVKEGVIDGGK